MSEHSGISWCDATFNPWWGCTKVSPACDHCYAERDAHRFAPDKVLWGLSAERRTFGEKHWNEPLRWARTMPAKLGRRPRVFCASMGDWLDLDAPIAEFVRLLDIIRLTPELDWLLLSKRIGNCRKRLAHAWDEGMHPLSVTPDRFALLAWIERWLAGEPPANVWLGATVVNQEEADRDIPKLLAVPARVRFLSIEPMLGAISFEGLFASDRINDGTNALEALDWVIAGGESGPKARPSHPDWYRSLREQCAAADVPFHFKQWGEWVPRGPEEWGYPSVDDVPRLRMTDAGDDGQDLGSRGGNDTWMNRAGKKAAGRLLDGVEHNSFPL